MFWSIVWWCHLWWKIIIAVFIIGEIVIINNLFELLGSVCEIGFGVKTLGKDSYVIIVLGGLDFSMDGSDVYFLLVDHYHHLPFAFVLADTSEFGASKCIFTHIVMWSFWLLSNKHLVRLASVDSSHYLILHLRKLFGKHVLLYLCFQAEEGRCSFILMVCTL